METYYESAEGMTITLARAIAEYANHGMTRAELISDLGEHEYYDAQSVLGMLGY